jgi:hypothetical protein
MSTIKQNEIIEYTITCVDNIIKLTTTDFTICFTLNFTSKNITKNIPVKYYIKLINNI